MNSRVSYYRPHLSGLTQSAKSEANPRQSSNPKVAVGQSATVATCSAEKSDEALLSLICAGDETALGLLFRRYARVVRGVAYQVLRDGAEADDLLQDIFLLVQRLCGTYDRAKSPAGFWILQMTYRRAGSRRRYLTTRQFYTRVDFDQAANRVSDAPRGSGCGDSTLGALERQQVLQAWSNELSESQRQTLHLFFFEGCRFEEIAAKLGQTFGNARNHYYRGLARLRKQISAGKLPGCGWKSLHSAR